MKFARLFGVRVKHDYYADGVCRDVRIEPTERTRRLVAGYRLRLRELPDGIDLSAELGADGKSPLVALKPGEMFDFDLRVRNPDFALFTDARDLPLKPVEVRCDRLRAEPIEIRFRARAARWAYYVVTDRKGTFSLVDSGDAQLAFSATDLRKKSDESDAIAVALARRYPDLQRWRFVSDKPVPSSGAAKKGIELRLAGEKVVSAIPRPSMHRLSRVKAKGASQPEHALHHVLHYLKAD